MCWKGDEFRKCAMILCFHFGADFFGCFHDAQRIFAENFADVGVGVALAHQRFGDLRQLASILDPVGHAGAVEIGAEADVIRAYQLYGVIDVVDDRSQLTWGSLPSAVNCFSISSFAFEGGARRRRTSC